MPYFFYSTWLLAEHLRLWNELIHDGCLWWCRREPSPAPSPSKVPAEGSTPPPEPGRASDRAPAAYFERLIASAKRIARHATYPGKQQAVEQCIHDVEDLISMERITAEQGEVLLEILSSACPQNV